VVAQFESVLKGAVSIAASSRRGNAIFKIDPLRHFLLHVRNLAIQKGHFQVFVHVDLF
jgi:hypothetical protein